MKSYYRIMAGSGSKHAEVCHAEKFIGADYEIYGDLTGKLPDNWREFNKKFIPIYLDEDLLNESLDDGLLTRAIRFITGGGKDKNPTKRKRKRK